MSNKIKVVLLCNYWSPDAETMAGNKHFFRELSPWIQERINLFKGKDDIELHIISPNYSSNIDVECFKDNIYYHFFHYAPSLLSALFLIPVKLILKHDEPYKIAERCANILTKFRTVTSSVESIISRVVPDVIHIFGSEVPDSAAGALNIVDRYPCILSIQGYAYLATADGYYLNKKYHQLRILFEKRINTAVKYRFCSKGKEYPKEFQPFESGQKPIIGGGSITRIPKVNAEFTEKEYDVAFFGRVEVDKGVEDLVHAIGLLHKKYGISLKTRIIGKCPAAYQHKLIDIIHEYGADYLLSFTGFIVEHEDVYLTASKAVMVVLPTHVDLMPNTIRESIAMGVPVVSSDVGYIPQLNKDRESIAIHRVGDIEDLSVKIKEVYENANYRQMLITNGRKTFNEQFSMKHVYERTVEVYQMVNFESNNPISHE